MLQLRGVVPAVTTPFDREQRLDVPAFRVLVEAVVQDGVHGLIVGGCTGEAWALSEPERGALFEAAAKQVGGRLPVIAGCGGLSVRDVLAKARMAVEAGCDAILVQPPSYILLGQDEVMDFYEAVAVGSELPLILYNIPRRAGISLALETVDRLADLPKVIALKESSKDFLVLSQMIRTVGGRIDVFAGYANLLGLAALTAGAVGYMDSSTPVLGRRSVEFFNAVEAGNLVEARRLQDQMSVLNAGFFGVGTFPAAVKVGLELMGRPGGPPRDPIRPLNGAQREKVRQALISAELLDEVVREFA